MENLEESYVNDRTKSPQKHTIGFAFVPVRKVPFCSIIPMILRSDTVSRASWKLLGVYIDSKLL